MGFWLGRAFARRDDDGSDLSGLSKVERKMLHCAPDLMSGPEAELALAAQEAKQRRKDMRWLPRPRAYVALLWIVILISNPAWLVQIYAWSMLMFLVISVALGPEKAHDGLAWGGRWFMSYWDVERSILQRISGFFVDKVAPAGSGAQSKSGS